MEEEVKQLARRNRRRQRAQRMQAQAARDGLRRARDADSGEDESPARDKPPRPRDKPRRRRSRDPLGEEDIIDGFAIMAFRTYEDLEAAIKCATSGRTTSLSSKPRLPLLSLPDAPRRDPHHHQPVVNAHGITLLHDAGTSDDSGRASERLTGSSVAPRDPDSSRDRLSDASSRCSSGKGYICDSEGDDDKASPDNSRNGSPRYHDPTPAVEDASENGPIFRVTGGAASAGGGAAGELAARGGSGGALALSRAPVGGSASPAPAPLPHPAPSPAPAALPPPALPPPHLPPAAAPHRAHRPPSAASAAAATAAHIPSLEARTPAPAAPPDPPVTDLQPSPTPAPPFPSHAAYPAQAAAAAAVPHDYRHAEHEARTRPPAPPPQPQQPHAPHAPHQLHQPHQQHPPRPLHHHHPPHPILPGQDVRPLSYHTNGVAHPLSAPGHAPPHSAAPVAPTSPKHLPPRPYGVTASVPPHVATSTPHVTLGLNSTVSNHSISYQSQPAIPSQKHVSLPSHGRPQHAPFGAPNHLPPSGVSHSIAQHIGHTTTNHSMANHLSHSAPPTSHTISNHVMSNHASSNHAAAPGAPSITSNSAPNFGPPLHNHRPLALAHPLHPSPASAPPTTVPTHSLSNHNEATSGPAAVVTSASGAHMAAPPPAPTLDTRPAPAPSSSLHSSGHTSPAAAVVTSFPPNGYLGVPGVPGPVPGAGATYAGASYPPLYAPYATSLQHSAHHYLPPSAASPRNTTDTRTSLAASPLVAPKTPKNIRPHTPGSTGAAGTQPPLSAPPLQPLPLPLPAQHVYSPRGHSPNRERDSYSSNISSLSRASGGTPVSYPSVTVSTSGPPAPLSSAVSAPPSSASLVAPLVAPLATPLAAPTPTPAAPPAVHLAHTLAPVPTVPSISSSKPPAHWGVSGSSSAERAHGFAAPPGAPLFTAPLPPPNPNPFSAESLFQTSPSADLLRRELDNRFLAAAGGAFSVRTEMHHHQHQHTHVHQHPPHHAPPPPHPAAPPPSHHPTGVFLPPPVPPMFKDVKMASLYRHGLGLGYPYSSGLLHPGLSPSTPFMPPSALSTFTPKPVVAGGVDTKPARPPTAKTGKWNAMHVRIAWEIYNHQQKGGAGPGGGAGAGAPGVPDKDKLRASTFPPVSAAHAPSLSHAAPPHHLYRSPYDHLPPSPYLTHHPHLGVSPFARYGAGAFPGAPPPFGLSPYASRDLALSSSLHAPHHPSSLAALHEAWRSAPRPPAPPPAAVAREHDERERARRERESRERRELDERERRKREMERVRQRSPLRNGVPEVKEERKEAPRPPPPLAYPPPPAWDPYRPYDLQHMRFTPLVEAAIRAEEDRAKMLSAYAAHHQQLKPGAGLHRPLPPHHAAPHPGLAPLAPLPPLDLLKKEEPR